MCGDLVRKLLDPFPDGPSLGRDHTHPVDPLLPHLLEGPTGNSGTQAVAPGFRAAKDIGKLGV